MKKRVLIAAIATTITCMSIVGCGKSNNESNVIEIAPGMTVVGSGNQGALTMESDEFNLNVTVDFMDPMGELTTASSEEAYVPVVESVADSFNVKLEDNQYIITANDKVEKAIILTALEGYKFTNQYSYTTAVLEKEDSNDSYSIYDGSDTLTKESLSDKKDIEEIEDGIYIENNSVIKAYCFKDDASFIIVYSNTSSDTDVDQVTANIKSIVNEASICNAK